MFNSVKFLERPQVAGRANSSSNKFLIYYRGVNRVTILEHYTFGM